MADDELDSRARAWWRELHETGGAAARLRRCQTTQEAVLYPETLSLIRRLGSDPRRGERVAALAVVLAHVTQDDPRPLMRAVGDSRFGAGDALLGETRFRRLMETADDANDLLMQLARIVRFTGGVASVGDLTTSLIWWNDRTRAAWARNYYAATTDNEETANV